MTVANARRCARSDLGGSDGLTRAPGLLAIAVLIVGCGTASPREVVDDAATTTVETALNDTTPELTVAPVSIRTIGPEEIVFDGADGDCGGNARPDLPVRVFRSGEQISVILSAYTNYRMVGSDFDELELDCDPILRSTYDHDPAQHAHHEWLAATYTIDGETIYGIVHNEYHGDEAAIADSRRAHLTDQDLGDWRYLGRTSTGDQAMTPAASGHEVAGGLCMVDFWGAHPDLDCDAISQWISDRAGPLTLEIESTKIGVGGNGVTLAVRVDGEPIWNETLTDDTPMAAETLAIEVEIGSVVEVGVAADDDASFDATELRLWITTDGDRCTANHWDCQIIELTAVQSTDGGATFAPARDEPTLVMSPPGTYRHNAGLAATWQPTNIVHNPLDDYFYMLVQVDEHRSGDAQFTCALRTADPSQPEAWRAWDGTAYTLAAVDAYATTSEAVVCAGVAPPPISGLHWSTELDQFLAVGGFTEFGENGHYVLTSPDLRNWSEPTFIRPAEFVYSSDTPPYEPYVALVDHDSASLSFDTVGTTAHLYFTRINDPSTLDFDLVRIPVEIAATE